jgi:hypothetical protein
MVRVPPTDFADDPDKHTVLHRLPKHNGSHPDYNDRVKTRLKKFKKDLKKTNCDSKNPPPLSVLNDMIKYQDDCFNFLKAKGKMNEGQTKVPTVQSVAQEESGSLA